MSSSSSGAPKRARTHKAPRPILQSGMYEVHGNYQARKSKPLPNALGIKSCVAKRVSKVVPTPRRSSGKWRELQLNTRLSYQGRDESGMAVWA